MTTSPGWSPGIPGFTSIRESDERDVLFQSFFYGDVVWAVNPNIDATAIDSGNTPTSVLRPGLVMAQLDSTGQWVDYDNDATDGSQIARGVLVHEVNMLDFVAAAAADRFVGAIVVRGKAKAGTLINFDRQARNQLAGFGFIFDDDDMPFGTPTKGEYPKTTDYTVVAADSDKLFTTTGAAGAVVFTLPTLANGLRFRFFNTVNQNMTVTSAAGNDMIIFNDAAASSVAFSTTGEKIGACVEVAANAAASAWLVTNMSSGNTVTIA